VPLAKVNGASALPGKSVYSADGSTLYVPLNGQNTVVALDPSTGSVKQTWNVGIAPRELDLVGEEVGDVRLRDPTGLADVPCGEEGDVGAQVARVGGQGVVRGAPFDPDVVEPPADVTLERRGAHRGWSATPLERDVLRQESASSSEIEVMPCASATGPYVTWPL